MSAALVGLLTVARVCDAFTLNHSSRFVSLNRVGHVSGAVSNVGAIALGARPVVPALLHDRRRKGLRRLDASLAKIPRWVFFCARVSWAIMLCCWILGPAVLVVAVLVVAVASSSGQQDQTARVPEKTVVVISVTTFANVGDSLHTGDVFDFEGARRIKHGSLRKGSVPHYNCTICVLFNTFCGQAFFRLLIFRPAVTRGVFSSMLQKQKTTKETSQPRLKTPMHDEGYSPAQ